VCRRIKQGAQDCRPRNFELPPKFGLGTPLLLSSRPHRQKNCAVAQIRPANDVFDPVQADRARRLKQHLFIISIELTDRETTTARKPAEGVGEPRGQARQIIEGKQMAIAGGNHQFALLARECSDRRHIGIDQGPEEF
jgi:hypothetical protein